MKFVKNKNINGYIEGYYGKLLTWDNRINIINSLSKNKMKFYFYCPKEDIYHRLYWKKKYPKVWLNKFNLFCNYARKKNVDVIAGISPGIDFDFKSYMSGNKSEINLILKKLQLLINNKVNYVALLLDDLPNDFHRISNITNEGLVHAKIINEVSSKLNVPFFAVPRIYADELSVENKYYINKFFKNLNPEINVFYCGKYVVSKNFSTRYNIINQWISKRKVIYWDNFYANDYCPKKIFLGPWLNKNLIEKSMINGTGLINTDLLILEIVKKTGGKKNKFQIWKKIFINNGIPKKFFKVRYHFLSPSFTNQKAIKNIKDSNIIIKDLDFLLWKWKSDLAREWYPYILNLKQDLQLLKKELTFNRILKLQTNPFQKFIFMRRKFK